MPHRLRFSIGQLMGVIALSALLTANAVFISRGSFWFIALSGVVLSCAAVGVLFSRGESTSARVPAWDQARPARSHRASRTTKSAGGTASITEPPTLRNFVVCTGTPPSSYIAI